MAVLVLAVGVAGLAAGCGTSGNGEGSSVSVSLEDLPDAARATVQKLTAGGRIERIDREVENGRVVYDVEATVGGKHVEFLVGEDGALLGTETVIDFSELPPAVQAAAAQYFDNTTGLTVSKVEEFGQVSYEITGIRNGKPAEAQFDPTGKLID
jgi:hypothetical protein